MKKSAILLSAALLLCACVKDYDSDIQEGPREWYQPVCTDTIICTDIANALTGYPIVMNTRIVRAAFMYHSGKENLSGCVCWPLGCQYNEEIWLENHYTSARWDQCPSQSYEPGMVICHTRQAVYVGADYKGLGLTKNLTSPYFNSPLLARQSIDCFKAALQVLKDNGISMASDFRTYNFGYSLGGSVALGVAKLIEQDPKLQKNVHLKKSFCGGGPYDQVAMIESYFKEPGSALELPAIMALDAENLLNSNLVPEITSLFSDKFIAAGILDLVESKKYDTDTLNRNIWSGCGYLLSDCLSSELLDTTGVLYHSYKNAHKAFDLTEGWEPAIPILMFHSKDDRVVPYDCMAKFKDRHKGNSAVTYVDHRGSHMNAGMDFYLKIIGEIWMDD